MDGRLGGAPEGSLRESLRHSLQHSLWWSLRWLLIGVQDTPERDAATRRLLRQITRGG